MELVNPSKKPVLQDRTACLFYPHGGHAGPCRPRHLGGNRDPSRSDRDEIRQPIDLHLGVVKAEATCVLLYGDHVRRDQDQHGLDFALASEQPHCWAFGPRSLGQEVYAARPDFARRRVAEEEGVRHLGKRFPGEKPYGEEEERPNRDPSKSAVHRVQHQR